MTERLILIGKTDWTDSVRVSQLRRSILITLVWISLTELVAHMHQVICKSVVDGFLPFVKVTLADTSELKWECTGSCHAICFMLFSTFTQ